MELLARIKNEVGCKIAVCGPHATALSKEILLNNEHVDFVLNGEYEFTTLELVKKLDKEKNYGRIKGLTFRKGRKVIKNPPRPLIKNLDILPWPARHLLPMGKYNEGFAEYPNQQMISSRGCPFHCIFCVYPQVFYNHTIRLRSAVDVVDEMEFLLDKYKPKEIYFDDDSFTIIPKHVTNICNEIIKRGLDIQWSCMGHANLSYDLLKLMVRSGCVGIKFGVESGSQDVLKKMGKPLDLRMVKKFVENCKKLGLKTHATYMVGLPFETKADMEKTLRFALELGTDSFQISIATPYPGTAFYKMVKENGWLVTNDFSKYDGNKEAVVSYPHLTKEEIDEAFRKGKDILAKFDTKLFTEYIKRAYEYKGVFGAVSFVLRKAPSYAFRLIRKQFFKLKIHKL